MFSAHGYMKATLCLLILTVFCASSCKKLETLSQVDVDVDYTVTETIPASIDPSAAFPADGMWISFPLVAVATLHDAKLKDNNTKADKLTFFGAEVMSYHYILPDSAQNFNFLDSAQVFVSATDLPEQLIGYTRSVLHDRNLIQLTPVTGLNLQQYFLKDTMYYRVAWHVHALPPAGDRFELLPTFNLLAKAL